MEVGDEQLCAGVVALVSTRGENALFEIGGVRAIEEQLLIVVGLDDDMVGRLDEGLHIVVGFAAVGSDHETLTEAVDDVAKAVGGVVTNAEGSDLHVKEGEGYAFFEIAS